MKFEFDITARKSMKNEEEEVKEIISYKTWQKLDSIIMGMVSSSFAEPRCKINVTLGVG
jgi:hypothetical protein